MNQFDNFEKFLQKEFEHFESETSDQSWEEIRAKLHPKPRRRMIAFWFLPFFALLIGGYFFYSRPSQEQIGEKLAMTVKDNYTAESASRLTAPDNHFITEGQAAPGSRAADNRSDLIQNNCRQESSVNLRPQLRYTVRNKRTLSTQSDLKTVGIAAENVTHPDANIENTATSGQSGALPKHEYGQSEKFGLMDNISILWPAEVVENSGSDRSSIDSRDIVKPVHKQKNNGIRISGSIGFCSNYQLLGANTADNFYVSNVNAPDPLSINRLGIQANIGLRFQLSRQFYVRPSVSYQGIRRGLDYVVYENEVKSWTGISFGNSYELSDIEFKNTQIRERSFTHTLGLQADLMWSPNKRDALSIGVGIGKTTAPGTSSAQWLVCSWQHRLQRFAVEPFVQYSIGKYVGLSKYYYYQPLSFGIKFGF